MKTCIRCKEEKIFTEFAYTNNPQYKDGYINVCKVCTRKRSKEIRQSKSSLPKEKITADKKKYAREYAKKRRQDPKIKLMGNTRSLIYLSFKRALNGKYKKSDKTENILGCGLNFFIKYLSANFQEGMCLSNYGDWHIDHKKPLSKAKTKKDILKLCHYTNLQPMWAIDNIKKGAKYEHTRSNS